MLFCALDNLSLSAVASKDVHQKGTIECPTCFKHFEKELIDRHADECVDSYWSNLDAGINEDKPETVNLAHAITAMKKGLKTKDPLLVTVRRKHILEDFKRARERYYNPSQHLKVTFSGEPAIDIGGPKRDFFAGRSTFTM